MLPGGQVTRQRHAPFLVISQLNRTCPATGQALLELSLKLFLLPTPLGFPLLFPTSNYNHQNSNIISKITICLSVSPFPTPLPIKQLLLQSPFLPGPQSENVRTFLDFPSKPWCSSHNSLPPYLLANPFLHCPPKYGAPPAL